jgi:hypothetical protein
VTSALADRESTAFCALTCAALLVAACSWAPSDFAKKASDAASTLAAAETTIRLRHEGKLTLAYARGSFVNYRDALEGVDEELLSLPGAPGEEEVAQLTALFRAAKPALEEPCLDNTCDWQSQEQALKRAADAFEKVAEL